MKHCLTLVAALVVLVAGSAWAQPTEPAPKVPTGAEALLPAELRTLPELQLGEVIRKALEFSPMLKSQQAVLEQVKTNTTRAWAMLLPTLDVTGSYTLTDQEIKINFMSDTLVDVVKLAMANCGSWDTASMGPVPALCSADLSALSGSPTVMQQRHNFDAAVTVSLPILNLRTWPNLANVYTAIELSELQKQFSEEQLVFSIVQVYYGVAMAQESIRLMTDVLANAMHHMDQTEVRAKNGVALENERIRAAMGVVQARSALDQAVLAWKLSRESLALLIGMQSGDFRVSSKFETPWDSVGAAAEDLASRRDIQMIKKAEVMADRGLDDAWAKFAPVIMGVWRWSISNNKGFAGTYDQWRAMITLQWSIFDGGTRLADVDERRARLRELRFNQEQALIQARVELAKARSEVDQAQLAITAGEENAVLAEKNLRLVEKQYELGASPQSSVLDAEMQYSQARIAVITSRLRLAVAKITLAKVAGKLYEPADFGQMQ